MSAIDPKRTFSYVAFDVAFGGKADMLFCAAHICDAKTGKIVWQFFLVPKTEGDTVRGPEGASPLDSSTWKNVPGAPISGGGTWTSTTLDPADIRQT
jgi:hypothetical protein